MGAELTMVQIMDGFSDIVNASPLEDAVCRAARFAGTVSNASSIEALARLLVVESARRRHAEARLAEALHAQEQKDDTPA